MSVDHIKLSEKYFMNIDKQRKIIGKQIRKRRLEFKLSQETLASQVGIRKATLSEIENGNNCTVNTLLGIIKQLDGNVVICWNEP